MLLHLLWLLVLQMLTLTCQVDMLCDCNPAAGAGVQWYYMPITNQPMYAAAAAAFS
jgi:hypothetical protein